MNHSFYISLGSNMGVRKAYLRAGIRGMKRQGIVIRAVSSLYETRPWGKTDQALFLNALVRADWDGEPEELMRRLLAVETSCGRVRDVHWGPRTLDLDLIFGEGIDNESALLHLPHPYFWDRAFVLAPLQELDQTFTYRGEGIAERLKALGGEKDVRRLGGAWIEEGR